MYKCSKYVNKNNECVNECDQDYNYIEDNECRKSCDKSNFAEPIESTYMFECKTKCSSDKYYYEEGNIFTVRKCLKDCGNDFVIQGTHICYTKCPSDYYSYTSYQNNTCVKKCPQDKKYIYLGQCFRECPSTQKYHLEGEFNCLSECPKGSRIDNNECRSECDGKFLDNNQCVDICTVPNVYYMEGSNLCVKNCEKGYYIEGKKCVKSCSENNSFINETSQSCVNRCESEKFGIKVLKNYHDSRFYRS